MPKKTVGRKTDSAPKKTSSKKTDSKKTDAKKVDTKKTKTKIEKNEPLPKSAELNVEPVELAHEAAQEAAPIAVQEPVQETAHIAAQEVVQQEQIRNDAIVNIRKRKIIGHEARTNRWGYVFVAPFLLAFLIFNFWPTINTFLVSFTDLRGLRNDYVFSNAQCPTCRGEGKIVSVDASGKEILDAEGEWTFQTCHSCQGKKTVTPAKYNYTKLVNDPYFWGALGNTFIIWGFNFLPQLGFALILAIWLSDARLNLAGKGMFRAVVYMPNLLTAASVAFLFRSLFGEGGHEQAPANQFLRAIGIWDLKAVDGEVVRQSFNFFRSVPFSRGLVAFIQWWMWYGHTLIMLMAGITSIPVSLYESATVDGANSRQTAWYITLPLLRPMMLYILITSMIGGMQMFDIPFALTNSYGSPDFKIRTTVLYQFNIAFDRGVGDKAYGAAISMGIFLVTITLAFLIFFFLQDRSDLKKKRGGVK